MKFIKRSLVVILILSMILNWSPRYQIFADSELSSEDNNGFNINISWGTSEFKNDSSLDIVEDQNVSNIVTARVSYSSTKVMDKDYAAGEFVITVKGIGKVNRDSVIEASVGADKASASTKIRDWSYTWNRNSDIYTFTNNNPISSNTVFSGYFDLVWNLSARNTIHGYTQDNIKAKLILSDGTAIESNVLTFSNSTKCDTFSVDISQSDMYSYEGLKVENPDDYAFIKYSLGSHVSEKTRGTKTSSFIFNPDVDGVGSDAIVLKGSLSVSDTGDGTYRVGLQQGSSGGNYIYVAYPKESYGEDVVTASLEMLGIYHEGDDEGVITSQQLATDTIQIPISSDFSFVDIPGEIYTFRKSYKGKGSICGKTMITGTTKTFSLGGFFNYSGGTSDYYDLQVIDDYMYILQNGGDYRKLEPDEYNFASVTIPGSSYLINSNNLAIASDTYEYELYAFYDGESVNLDDKTKIYSSGVIKSYNQVIKLDKNTTAVAVVLKGIKENISNFSIPVSVDYHIKDTSSLKDFSMQDNLTSGKVINTSFIKIMDAAGAWWNGYTDDNYVDNTNLNLAENDKAEYGGYVDRAEASINFYAGENSDYHASSVINAIEYDGKKFTSQIKMGANFEFQETDVPDKFSLYTILPDGVYLDGYSMTEDLYDVMELSGMNLSSDILASRCTVEAIENYKDSGRMYIALHFDLTDLDIKQNSSIIAKFNIKISNDKFKNSGTTIPFRSSIIVDKEISAKSLGKYTDTGTWYSDTALASDIDNDGVITESLSYDSDYSSYTYVESSEFRMEKYVKTSATDDYTQLPEIPLAGQESTYNYMLVLKSGESTTTDIIIEDVLESSSNSEWQGTFNGLNMSSANELGLTYDIYYSDSESEDWVLSEDWTKELCDVKAIHIDFGSSELKPKEELKVIINMIAPNNDTLKGKITENNFKSSFTMISSSTGNEVKQDLLESNYVQVKLAPKLKTIILTKVDEYSGSKLSGASYELVDESGVVIASGTTNSNGQIVFKNIPSDVDYILKEIKAPYGYELNEDKTISFDDSNILRITEEDKRKLASIEIYKSNELDESIKVEDAEYTLFTKDGVEVQTGLTNINGKLVFEDVNWGEYYVKETSAPKGYLLDDTSYPVVITRDNVDESIVFNVTDSQDGYTEVLLNKYESTTTGVQTDIPLEGAVFKLIRTNGSVNKSIGTYVTDENGEIYVSDLPYGNYKFTEVNAPIGYIKAEDIAFVLSPDNTSESLKVYDKRKTGTVTLTKSDNLGNLVSGVVFELYDENDLVIGTYTTSSTGVIKVEGLEWGSYYFKEKSTLSCYQLSTDKIEFDVNVSNLEILLSCVNETKKGIVVLTKTDELGLHNLEGAEFSLYREDGTLLYEQLTTDANGQLKVENLEWGKYYFKETKAPSGYALTDETIRFAVNSLNAGLEQSLYVTNPQDSKSITISKKILANEINFDNGDPTFLFKIHGTDINNDEHTYYRIMRFDEDYVLSNVDDKGFISQSVTISGLLAGIYIVSEEESSRYSLSSITDLSDNATLQGNDVSMDLSSADEASVTFVNDKYEYGDYSDNSTLANSIKKQAKLTSVNVSWLGDASVKAKSEIDRSLVKVIANYDDGSYKVLEDTDWSFESSFSGTYFPNINGDYLIPIEYSEGNITKEGSFSVEIYGMELEVVKLEASMNEGYESLLAGSEITPDMLTVYAVYNDASKKLLSSDSFSSDSSDYTVNSNIVPSSGVSVDLEISLNPLVFDEDISTVIYILITYPDPILVDGETFKSSIPSAATKVVFTDSEATTTSTVDLSKESNGSVVGWLEDKTWYVSSQRDGVKAIANEDCYKMFYYKKSIINIDFTYLDTSNVKDMSYMFYDCSGLTSLDLSSFDTSNVTNMSTMFFDCYSLTSLDLSSWGTSKVTNMSQMFFHCSGLTSLDLSSWDTSNVTNMAIMFNNCAKLTSLDVSSFDTSNVTNMDSMFDDCKGLTSLDLSSFDTSKVTNMDGMFDNCYSLTSLDLSSFDTSNVTTMYQMFYECYGLTSLDLSNFDTSNVTNMREMFYYCFGLTSLDLSNFDTSKVTNMSEMFFNCSGLTSLDLSNFDTSKVKNISSMFKNCYRLTSLDVSSFDTSNVTNMDSMFYNCKGLTSLDLSSFDTSKVTNMSNMFNSCYALESINLSSFNTSKVTDMSFMFYLCKSLLKVDVSNFDTSNVTNMSDMFYYCNGLTSLDLSSFDTSKVINVERMFKKCSSVINAYARTQKDADMFNNSSEKPTSWMFNSVKPELNQTYTVDSAYVDLITLDIPSRLEEGLEVNLIPTNNEVIASFRVTGYKDAIQAPDGNWYFSGTYDKSFVGNKFTIPTSDGFYTITDVEFLNVTNKSSDLVTVNMPSEFELGVSEISLSPIDSNHYIKSFKVNGETFEGDSFIITENIGHNITISDIVLVERVIIESEHNPYPNSLNKVVYGEASFENATSLSVELTYQTESTNYDWIYLYDADGNIVNNKKYGGKTQKTETITVSGNYVKIVFRTDSSGNNYYGFKAVVIPVYE